MSRKKSIDEWISGNQAAGIMTKNSGHPVSANYVRLLATKGMIRFRRVDGRTNEYHKGDVENYKVERKSKTETAA